MSSKKQRRVLILVVGLIFSILSIPAMAADFPSKPITLYVGFEPGAGTDITARVLAKEAEKLLGVPVVVENKPGGKFVDSCRSLGQEEGRWIHPGGHHFLGSAWQPYHDQKCKLPAV